MSTIPISISRTDLDTERFPLVSVVMPSYNSVAYIKESIESVLKQDYPNIQFIISDDGSTDGTADIVRAYAERFPDIIVAQLHPANLGLATNVESMYPLIKGRYIAWFAGDDLYYPGKIKAQVAYMQAHPDTVMCAHDIDVVDSNGTPLYRYNDPVLGQPVYLEHIAENLVQHRCFFSGLSAFVNVEKADGIKHREELGPCADWFMFVEFALRGPIGYLPEVYGAYRRHPTNITRKSQINWEEVVYTRIIRDYPQLRPYAYNGLAYLYLTGTLKHALRRDFKTSWYCLRCLAATFIKRPLALLFVLKSTLGGLYRRLRLQSKTGSMLR